MAWGLCWLQSIKQVLQHSRFLPYTFRSSLGTFQIQVCIGQHVLQATTDCVYLWTTLPGLLLPVPYCRIKDELYYVSVYLPPPSLHFDEAIW
jgi:hypothetical protein